ncbi:MULTISPECIES: TolC family protein [Thermomonas]|uniref:TolC family protein n=1 Tax=Thermomonas TaxID=141948 RepID=UPI00048C37FF|nr:MULTISPECIES: TolC family protein [Thermomonas]
MNLRWLMALAFAGAHGVVLSGHAAEPLRLEEAVARSLAANPSLAAEAAELRAVQARAEREGLPTPYVAGADLENVAGTGALSGVHSAETTLRLGRVIELGGKRAARQALGAAEVARQRNASDTVRIDIASRTTARFIEVVADQQRLEFAREQVKLADRTRREVATWVAAARNPESDLRAAEIAVADAELEREHAEHELASARMTLAASWGAFEPDFTAATGDLRELPQVESFETLATRLPMTPAQRSALLEAEEIAARRRVAQASAKPDINVSLGVRRLEALGDQGLVISVSVPLGSKPRASLAIAEADAQLAALESRRDAQRLESHQALFEKYQELMHARTEYEALRTRMLPKAEQALAVTRRGFEAGRFSFVSLAQAQRTLFDLRARSVEAAARYHTRLVEVERLTAVATEATP